MDFADTHLYEAVLTHCDLAHAKFENTNREKADLRGSSHSDIDPVVNRIHKAKFSMDGLPGLLTRYQIIIE